jgi:hypothetical protein
MGRYFKRGGRRRKRRGRKERRKRPRSNVYVYFYYLQLITHNSLIPVCSEN